MTPNVGKSQRNRLAAKVTRLRKSKLAAVIDRQPRPSERMAAKAQRRATYLDQVELDKLNGLENGAVCRDHYRKLPRKQAPKRVPRKDFPRPADTYRAARRNAERGPRRSLLLKEERLRTGETRSQMDRRIALA